MNGEWSLWFIAQEEITKKFCSFKDLLFGAMDEKKPLDWKGIFIENDQHP